MITFLTTFKPLVGDDDLRQRNALLSWLALDEDVEVMVFGHTEGLAPVVRSLGLIHYPDVPCIGDRLPRADAMFEIAQRYGKHELQAYVNGDIILGPDFLKAVLTVPFPRFLMVGVTWRAEIWADAQMPIPERFAEFRQKALSCGRMLGVGADFFAYRRKSLDRLPPLAVGAVPWDNYMIEHCRRRAIPVIDATADVVAIHQKHDYAQTPTGGRITEHGPGAEHNLQIAGGRSRYLVQDASHVLVHGTVRPSWTSLPHVRHRLAVLPARGAAWRRWRLPIRWVVGLLSRVYSEPTTCYASESTRTNGNGQGTWSD